MDECTFCITFGFKAEGYTESTLIHRGCPALISKIVKLRKTTHNKVTPKTGCRYKTQIFDFPRIHQD